VKAQTFRPLPVRERMIPKAGGKLRRLGIATVRDRVVQAALKLVLEPIWEADFLPCSYGFRPKRRAHDAIAEIRTFASAPHRYEWVLEGDIAACFDEISHSALLDRVRQRITDRRIVALIKAFLKAGIFNTETGLRDSQAGTPQRGNLVTVTRQPRSDGARRALRPARPPEQSPSSTATPATSGLSAVPVRRRLGSAGQGRAGRRRVDARRGGNSPRDDGPAPVAGEDNDHPHR
jgi:hypothetical protein